MCMIFYFILSLCCYFFRNQFIKHLDLDKTVICSISSWANNGSSFLRQIQRLCKDKLLNTYGLRFLTECSSPENIFPVMWPSGIYACCNPWPQCSSWTVPEADQLICTLLFLYTHNFTQVSSVLSRCKVHDSVFNRLVIQDVCELGRWIVDKCYVPGWNFWRAFCFMVFCMSLLNVPFPK